MAVDIKESGPGFEGAAARLKALMRRRVLVGIPQEKSSRKDAGPTNAELAFIHSHGSPLMHIPARPFIEPALESAQVKRQIAGCMADALAATLSQGAAEASDSLHKAGLYGENAVKRYFRSGELAPNAPITVEGGWMRNRVSGKPVYVPGKHANAPLRDTGSLRKSITHVVEEGD